MEKELQELAPGSFLGRYRISRVLGAGAMGSVYLAEDPQIERPVAIKTVRMAGGPQALADRKQRLLREAKAAGRLLHPHAVTLFDAGEDRGVVYLAFEYVEGQDLAGRLQEPPPLQLGEALRIVRQTAEALDFAHQRGIVHRDIKPSNILLTTEGHAKISDFGIAKVLGQSTELTTTGAVVGSPHYMSPEQVRGEPLDGRSDLFSLGSVFYELLTRSRAFDGDTLTTLVYQILHQEPPELQQVRPDLPPRLASLLRRMLVKEREQRFAKAGEVARETAAIEAELPESLLSAPAWGGSAVDAPTQLLPSSTAPPVGSLPRSRVGRWAALAVLGAGVAVGGGWWILRPEGRIAVGSATVSGAGRVEPQSTSELLGEEEGGGGSEADGPPPVEARPPAAEGARSGVASLEAQDASPRPADSGASKPDSAEPSAPSELPGSSAERGRRVSSPVPAPATAVPSDRVRASRPGSSPRAAAPPTPEPLRPAAEPASSGPPASQIPVAASLETGLLLGFQVVPPDTFVLIKSVEDRRFTQVGRAAEFDTRTKSGEPFELAGPGRYLVRLRKPGLRDHVISIDATDERRVVAVSARLEAMPAAALELGDLELFEVREAVAFRVVPPSAQILVDGDLKGRAKDFSGGRWLFLEPGRYRISVVAAGYQRRDLAVEVRASAKRKRERIDLTLSR